MATLPKVEERKHPLRQPETLFILPTPGPKSHRALRPLWRDLILKTWGEDPQRCPCCNGKMKNVGTIVRFEEIEFFLRLHGIWEGIISLPPPPDTPFDIEKRRGIGGVLDVGEAEARREILPGGAGESNMESLNVLIHWSWTMVIPSFSMETTHTNSQTFPRSPWADGRSFRIAKTASRESCRTPVSGTPDFSTTTPPLQSGPVDSWLTALTPACFHGQISP
jgi:hypothetical protein